MFERKNVRISGGTVVAKVSGVVRELLMDDVFGSVGFKMHLRAIGEVTVLVGGTRSLKMYLHWHLGSYDFKESF